MTWCLDGVEDEQGRRSAWSAKTADSLSTAKPQLAAFVQAVAAVGMTGRRLRMRHGPKSMQQLQVRAQEAERATLHLGAAVPGVEDVRAAFIRLSRYISTANRFRKASDSASQDADGDMSLADFGSRHEEKCDAKEDYEGTIAELESAIEYSLQAAERLWKSQ